MLTVSSYATHSLASGSDPGAAWASDIVGALITAFVAFAGVITLFWLQQNAARRAERQAAKDRAFADLAQAFLDLEAAARSGDAEAFRAEYSALVNRLARAFWFVDTKDEHVATWIMSRTDRMIDQIRAESDLIARGVYAQQAFHDVTVVLRRWRYDRLNAAKFRELAEEISD